MFGKNMERASMIGLVLITLLSLVLNAAPMAAADTLESATILFVSSDGVDEGNDCLSPVMPCSSPQYAADQSSDGDSLYISDGTYDEVEYRGDFTQTLYINTDLVVVGGWDEDFESHDPRLHPTVINPNSQGRAVTFGSNGSGEIAHLSMVNGWGGIRGGCMYITTGDVTLTGNIFSGCSADDGGALWANGGDLSAHSNIVANNIGGGFYLSNVNGQINNNTFVSNEDRALSISFNATGLGNNNIFSGNATAAHGGGPLELHRSLFWNNDEDTSGDVVRLDDMPAVDPELEPNNHLHSSSPCINAGLDNPDVLVDVDGQARPEGPNLDLGADEWVNSPPIADAGEDQTVNTGSTVFLNGNGSFDPDGHEPLSYLWEQVSGPDVVLVNPNTSSPSFTAPSEAGILTFSLIVTDSLGRSSEPDEVIITVEDNIIRIFLPILLNP